MNANPNIPAGYSTRQAAQLLGVSCHEVSRLIRSEKLRAVKTHAGMYIIDSNSLHELEAKIRTRGRPWDASTAWAALLALEGCRDHDLSYHRQRRLAIALKEIDAIELVAKSRKRSSVERFAASPSFAEDVRERLVPSGISDRRCAQLGLSVSSNQIDGYAREPLDEIVRSCWLIPDSGGECVIRIPHDLPTALDAAREMPLSVVAADLAESANIRERRCGLDYLQRRLDEYGGH